MIELLLDCRVHTGVCCKARRLEAHASCGNESFGTRKAETLKCDENGKAGGMERPSKRLNLKKLRRR